MSNADHRSCNLCKRPQCLIVVSPSVAIYRIFIHFFNDNYHHQSTSAMIMVATLFSAFNLSEPYNITKMFGQYNICQKKEPQESFMELVIMTYISCAKASCTLTGSDWTDRP